MAGFQKSPEYEQAVDALLKMQETKGLQDGWAILDLDLAVINWQKDEWGADELIGAGVCKARVPDMPDRYVAEASLLAGLTYTLLSDRHMAEFEYDGPQDLSKFVDGQRRVEYHLFGGRPKTEVISPNNLSDDAEEVDAEDAQIRFRVSVDHAAWLSTFVAWEMAADAQGLYQPGTGDGLKDRVVKELRLQEDYVALLDQIGWEKGEKVPNGGLAVELRGPFGITLLRNGIEELGADMREATHRDVDHVKAVAERALWLADALGEEGIAA